MINLKCIFGHKWNYYQETEERVGTFGSSSGYAGSTPSSYTKKYFINSDFRICESCYRKQENKSYINSNKWIDVPLNKKDIRDKKLKNLGI
jgi:hypothetical protein